MTRDRISSAFAPGVSKGRSFLQDEQGFDRLSPNGNGNEPEAGHG